MKDKHEVNFGTFFQKQVLLSGIAEIGKRISNLRPERKMDRDIRLRHEERIKSLSYIKENPSDLQSSNDEKSRRLWDIVNSGIDRNQGKEK